MVFFLDCFLLGPPFFGGQSQPVIKHEFFFGGDFRLIYGRFSFSSQKFLEAPSDPAFLIAAGQSWSFWLKKAGSKTPSSDEIPIFAMDQNSQNSGPGPAPMAPMSPRPVLLGRESGAAGVNVGVGDAPKLEGQTGRPCHGDIEASPSPTVTRVTHGEDESRPSWTWRIFQSFIALLVVIFTTWLVVVAFGSQKCWDTPGSLLVRDRIGGGYKQIRVLAVQDDPSFIALMVSTGIAGLAAMWLYLIAPTAHTLLAARFLCLNWVEGLVTISFMSALKGFAIGYILQSHWGGVLPLLGFWRLFLWFCEFVGLQLIIQNRLQSLWPALNRPECKRWLAWCLWMEVGSLFVGIPSFILFGLKTSHQINLPKLLDVCTGAYVATIVFVLPTCFLIWILLMATALCRVVMMFHKALKTARQQGLAVAATFQACRGKSFLQCTGVIISLATSFMLVVAALADAAAGNIGNTIFIPFKSFQCINLLVNAAGIILLSGASNLITSEGTLRFAPLRCCRCRCRFRRCCGFRSPCRSTNLKIGDENDWEKKTRELANRGISLEKLIAFYKGLGDTVMLSFQPSVHTTNDVVRLAVIPLTSSDCMSYAQLVNKGQKVLPKKMVTHNWSNLFRDLLGLLACVGKCLAEKKYNHRMDQKRAPY